MSKVKHTEGENVPWQAECPYHSNMGDPEGTKCRKRLQMVSEAETIARLKKWCIAGLDIGTSVITMPRHRHRDINPRTLVLDTLDEGELAEALNDRLEEQPPPPALQDHD